MAIDLTGQAPQYATDATVGKSTATQLRGPPGTVCKILASDAMLIFAPVDDGGAIPAAAARVEYTQAEMAQGLEEVFPGAYPGTDYGVISIAGASGVITVRASTVPPRREYP